MNKFIELIDKHIRLWGIVSFLVAVTTVYLFFSFLGLMTTFVQGVFFCLSIMGIDLVVFTTPILIIMIEEK